MGTERIHVQRLTNLSFGVMVYGCRAHLRSETDQFVVRSYDLWVPSASIFRDLRICRSE